MQEERLNFGVMFEIEKIFERTAERYCGRIKFNFIETRERERRLLDLFVLLLETLFDVAQSPAAKRR